MKKVLFVIPMYDTIGPRSIRFKNLLANFSKDFASDFVFDVLKFDIASSSSPSIFTLPLSNWVTHLIFGRSIFAKLAGILIRPDVKLLSLFSLASYFKQIRKTSDSAYTVMVFTRPFSYYLGGFIAKKWYSKRAITVLDLGDPYYQNSATTTTIFNKWFEQFCLRYYDYLVVTNIATKNFMIETYGFLPDRIAVIPQGTIAVDSSEFINTPQPQSGAVVFSYAGAFYAGLREPYSFLKAIQLINRTDLAVQFIGVAPVWTKDYPFVQHLPRMENAAVMAAYMKSDVLVFFDNAYGIQTSGKIYELVALNKPLLLITTVTRRYIFDEFKDLEGVVIADETVASIQKQILYLLEGSLPCDRSAVQLRYSWHARSVSYLEFLSQMVDGKA
ncbi:hypothetical protein GFJ94_06590 [Flavobacterium sp. LMO8]|uniref:hypothetical protein n=1 Tax=Flavobacterium sp. LMO8 TaxID=2654244 RepID=UPI0012910638|nr:hypothetical protein [Flavobacterium sp. LMO8]MQP24729.1 hypothetical protein [Flavobacterium sp. LMO8]